MDETVSLIAILVYSVAFGVLSSLAAAKKNRSSFDWFILGLVFGIFGFAAAIIVGPIDRNSSSVDLEGLKDKIKSDSAKCPYCAELIKREAKICRYCSRDLPATWVEDQMTSAEREHLARIAAERAQAERDAADKAAGRLTASEKTDMEKYSITHDGEHFWFGQYRYRQLSDAVNYAKLMQARNTKNG